MEKLNVKKTTKKTITKTLQPNIQDVLETTDVLNINQNEAIKAEISEPVTESVLSLEKTIMPTVTIKPTIAIQNTNGIKKTPNFEKDKIAKSMTLK